MLCAPTRPAITGLTARPIKYADVRNPNATPRLDGGRLCVAAVYVQVVATPSANPNTAAVTTSTTQGADRPSTSAATEPAAAIDGTQNAADFRRSRYALIWLPTAAAAAVVVNNTPASNGMLASP